MKRLTLLTILLVVVGLTAGFALEVKPSFTLSGSATAKWGVDLLTGNHGFNNTSSADLVVTLMAADGSDTHAAKDGWYGSITLSNVEASLDAPNGVVIPTPDVAAKIVGMGGNLEIGIYGKPSLKYEYAGFVPLFSADDGYATVGAVTPSISIAGGLSVLYKLAGIGNFTVKVASIGDWGVTAAAAAATTYTYIVGDGVTSSAATATTSYTNVDGSAVVEATLTLGKGYIKAVTAAATAGSGNDQYAFGADFALTAVKDLTFAFGAIYDIATEYLGFGAKAGYTVAGLSFNVGFDGQLVATVLDYDLAASVGYKFMKDKDSISVNVYDDSADRLDVGVLFTDAEGFVPGLSFTLGAYGNDLMGAQTMSFAESASYKVMMGDVNYVKPYEKVVYDMDTPAMYLNVGVEAKFIPNTVFTLDFAGGKTANDNNAGLVGTDIAGYQVLSIAAKVSY